SLRRRVRLPDDPLISVELTFRNERSQPALSRVHVTAEDIQITMDQDKWPAFHIVSGQDDIEINPKVGQGNLFREGPHTDRNSLRRFLAPILDWEFETLGTREPNKPHKEVARNLSALTQLIFRLGTLPVVYASAPFRTQPERTYSPVEIV